MEFTGLDTSLKCPEGAGLIEWVVTDSVTGSGRRPYPMRWDTVPEDAIYALNGNKWSLLFLL